MTKILDESRARIILLCAPAGYGKTTLAREWIATRSEPVAWYRGGAEMLDVAAVANGLAEALRGVGMSEAAASRIGAIASRTSSPGALGRALASSVQLPHQALLVVDDYHHAPVIESEQLFATFVEQTSLRIVLASRARPTWLTSRLCVYGDAIVLGLDDLAFTDDEARCVLNEHAARADRLLSQAAGWPAVIGLAAQRRKDPLAIDGSLLPSELYDFVADDLFTSAPVDLQRSLFLLALGGDPDPDTSYKLLGANAVEHLADASERGFISHASPAGFELHPLIRAFLLAKAREQPRADLDAMVREVLAHLRVARRWDSCLRLLEEFWNATLAAETLEDALFELLESGRFATIKRWLGGLSAYPASPTLLLARSEIAMREGSNAEAQALAEQAAALSLAEELAARAHLVAARAAHLAGDDEAAQRNASRARSESAPPSIKVAARWLEFLQAFENQDPRARGILDELRNVQDTSPEHALRLRQSDAFLFIEDDCDVYRALRELRLGLALLEQATDPITKSSFRNLLSSSTVYAGRYEQAFGLTESQLDEALAEGLTFARDYAYVTRSAALIGLRQLGAAQRLLQVLEKSANTSSFVAAEVVLKSARLKATAGDVTRAEQILRTPPPRDIPRALLGEWLAHRALFLSALGLLDDARAAIDDARSTSRYIDALDLTEIAEAIVHIQAQGGRNGKASAQESVRSLFARGHLDVVVIACRVFPELARVAADDSTIRSMLIRLFAESHDSDLGRAVGLAMPRAARARERLSNRERDVFELIAQGRTNREIAKTLFISESTTKVHVHHILEKLRVRSRTEAVRAYLGNDSD
ncbi:MAG TPA: LuxR C-terminal-related transcriptional regulator [Gaiellaceae bacterium]